MAPLPLPAALTHFDYAKIATSNITSNQIAPQAKVEDLPGFDAEQDLDDGYGESEAGSDDYDDEQDEQVGCSTKIVLNFSMLANGGRTFNPAANQTRPNVQEAVCTPQEEENNSLDGDGEESELVSGNDSRFGGSSGVNIEQERGSFSQPNLVVNTAVNNLGSINSQTDFAIQKSKNTSQQQEVEPVMPSVKLQISVDHRPKEISPASQSSQDAPTNPIDRDMSIEKLEVTPATQAETCMNGPVTSEMEKDQESLPLSGSLPQKRFKVAHLHENRLKPTKQQSMKLESATRSVAPQLNSRGGTSVSAAAESGITLEKKNLYSDLLQKAVAQASAYNQGLQQTRLELKQSTAVEDIQKTEERAHLTHNHNNFLHCSYSPGQPFLNCLKSLKPQAKFSHLPHQSHHSNQSYGNGFYHQNRRGQAQVMAARGGSSHPFARAQQPSNDKQPLLSSQSPVAGSSTTRSHSNGNYLKSSRDNPGSSQYLPNVEQQRKSYEFFSQTRASLLRQQHQQGVADLSAGKNPAVDQRLMNNMSVVVDSDERLPSPGQKQAYGSQNRPYNQTNQSSFAMDNDQAGLPIVPSNNLSAANGGATESSSTEFQCISCKRGPPHTKKYAKNQCQTCYKKDKKIQNINKGVVGGLEDPYGNGIGVSGFYNPVAMHGHTNQFGAVHHQGAYGSYYPNGYGASQNSAPPTNGFMLHHHMGTSSHHSAQPLLQPYGSNGGSSQANLSKYHQTDHHAAFSQSYMSRQSGLAGGAATSNAFIKNNQLTEAHQQ